ncbi:MBOAT family protein [Psychroserpens sp. XS_ASV72]|uniref:MBOAT family O-acyltransferase n=1 Tax=Psychroserpens sp. XS_ASV72 TaxID=3241293 RepID=UPI003518B605
MLFNSIDFAVFLPICFIIYWLFRKHLRLQNVWILIASYVFYGWWDWRFLFLIFFSTVVDYFVGQRLMNRKSEKGRKHLLYISVFVNIGLLGFFKYFNFFLDNFVTAFTFFGAKITHSSLNIILPVGISFYTFQTLSYTIDVYKKKLDATRDFVAFAAFVSFFPQLVAGPIERAKHLLPQFFNHRKFNKVLAKDGLRQMLWGFFKKMVIADNCAIYVNDIFNNSSDYSGSTLVLGAFLFAFQIYGDFSGYSDIAIGTSRLFGFDLMKNFNFPYFSRDIAEFWRRWHISLSTWFRDYLYIPLGGSKGSRSRIVRNVFIIFLVSGFWHGANWTFIVWGFLNALYFLPLLLTNKNRKHIHGIAEAKMFPSFREGVGMLFTFGLTVFAWIFFRADSIGHAFQIISEILSQSLFVSFEILPSGVLILILIFVIIEWFNRHREYGLEYSQTTNRVKKIGDIVLVSFVFWAVVVWHANKEVEFIYFQF